MVKQLVEEANASSNETAWSSALTDWGPSGLGLGYGPMDQGPPYTSASVATPDTSGLDGCWGSVLEGEDFDWLEKALKVMYSPESMTDVVRKIAIGEYLMVRLKPGIMVLRILQSGQERELNVYMVSGKGYLKGLLKVVEQLRALAQLYNCKWISGIAIRPGLERVYRKVLQAKPVGTYMLVEV